MYSTPLLEFLNMGGGEMMLIIIAILLLFGGKITELARGLGKGMREFKDASEGVKREIHRNINSFDTDEEDRKADANRSYRAPEEDNTHSIHEETTSEVATENQNDTTPVDTKEENKEPKSSV